jgi:carbon storage regulator
MLIIRRRVGERIVIGSNIEVTVASATKSIVRLAIQAPKGIPVLRGEVHDAVVEANVAAASGFIELEFVDDSVDAGGGGVGQDEASEENHDSD